MDESEDNMSAEDTKSENSQSAKTKPKKRSIVERELETSLTSRVTSPITNVDASSTSRYGRARRIKTEVESHFEKFPIKVERSPNMEKTPVKIQSPVYKMHASNSPMQSESPKGTPNKIIKIEPNLDNQIENIYHENISLSRFGSDEKKHTPNKIPKVYVRKDLIQKREEEESITLIKNLFSPAKSAKKTNSHIKNILERSSEKYGLNVPSKSQNGYASVVKTLDFDSKKNKKKENGNTKTLSKSELFEMEAKCEYQVGDLAWSRMGTYPFWPCIVTREPSSGMFVKKKLFGRIERDIIHVTFFGDNGRRGWIVDSMLRKFHGQLEFEATRDQFTPTDKKKDPRLYAAFFVSEKKLPQWNISVEEAELLLREPKRLRIDILNDMLLKGRTMKSTPRQNKSGKIMRTASDVSLSESLYDTLFSEDDGKEDSERSRNRSRNKSLDVSDVVTACLDNMAAKTGITKIQRQSHMDRWLQKAKSSTPEKSQAKAQFVPQIVEKKEMKVSNPKKKRSPKPNTRPLTQKPYSFRRSANESQQTPLEQDNINNLEFTPSLNSTLNNIEDESNDIINIEQLQSGIGIIAKVESLSDSVNESLKDEEDEHINEKNTIEDEENKKCVTENIAIKTKSESTNHSDSLKDYQGVDSIEAKSSIESESYLASISLESDKVAVDTNNKTLDSIEMNTSSTEEEKTETVEKFITDTNDKPKSLTEESTEENNIAIVHVKGLNRSEMDISSSSSVKENEESSEIESKNNFKVNIIQNKFDATNLNTNSPNILLNGAISDHDASEMSSKNSDLKDDSTQNSSSSTQEHSKDDFNKSLCTEIAKKPYTDPEFLKYLEIRQDSLMDQYPDLSQEEIEEYLYQTWLYEEKSAGEHNATDNKQSSKTSNKSRATSKKKHTRTAKQRNSRKVAPTDEYKEIGKPEKILLGEKQKNDTINQNEIFNYINVPKKSDAGHLIDVQNKPNNEILTESDELKNTNAIILNSNIANEFSEILENVSDSNVHESNECVKENSSVLIIENKEALHENTDVSHYKDVLLDKENLATDKSSDSYKENTAACTQNTSKKETSEHTSVSNEKLKENFSSLLYDEEMSTQKYMEDSQSKIKLHKEEETMSAADPSVTESQFISNCKPIKVGVNEETEVEIIANKEQSINDVETRKEYDPMLVSAVDLDDEFSDDSIDISYAISPLSVKGDDPNDDLINMSESDIQGNQNNKAKEILIAIGTCDSDVQNVEIDQCSKRTDIVVKDVSNEAGPKGSTISETRMIRHDDFLLDEGGKINNQYTFSAKEKGNEEEINDSTMSTKEKNKEGEILTERTVPSKTIADSIEPPTDAAKMNGAHVSKFVDDLEGDNSSIHSEDSEPLSVTKSKLKLKKQERVNKYADPEFVKYLEMRQDDVIDEHPELNQDEVVEYLYKTWLYEENIKSEIRRTDEVEQSSLIKGLGEPKPESKKRKPREIKEKKMEKDTMISKDIDVETASAKSEESMSLKRWLRPKRYTSKLYADFDSSRDSSPAITDDVNSETISLNSLDSDDSRANKYSPRSKSSKPAKVKTGKLFINDDVEEKEALDLPNDIDLTKPSNSLPTMVNGFHDNDTVNVKEEFDVETASLNSEGSEVSVSKRKQKSKGDKKMDDPEFVKYLELRQDTLIDENPQLTHEEIVGYLYKTWLYEESVKSDMKKSDEIEQSNLIKGINQDISIPKRVVRKKIKVEKDYEDTIKAKPKRKTIQPYYNEDYSDIEEEIAIFEIMKNSPKVELSKMDFTEFKNKELESKSKVSIEKAQESVVQKEVSEEVIQIEDEIDEVELYFEELTQPKPNLFKGLIREKVCEICEKVGNLVKCKSCNGMFHVDCVKRELEVVEKVSIPTKGRKKKKKKPGRRAKNLEDSGSLSDDKSQDVSAENMSVDEIIEPVTHTVDAVNFEAQLEAKMKELLEGTDKEIHYDSYSSDDGLDWEGTVAGKCEIVDVKLKPKSQSNDYSDFKCNNCQKYEVPICFVCKSAVSKTGVEYRQRCQVAHCHKYYHLECLDHWPQTQFSSGESWNKKTNEKVETHMCPRHVCHTCVSDDPRGCKTRFSGDKLARCVRCPATYHSFTKCLPAGTQILTGSHIICPRHYEHRPGKVPCHVNTGWCFICALGGTLICCEYCPTSFHAECLNISPPEGNYMCEDCETGRLPLYGEMVWVKLGHYRWWPGLILHPSEIPDNIMAVKHSPGEFVVRFFGQYDHYWVNRGRVFPFQEGDSGKVSSQKSKIDAAFTMAMEHAQRACQILKNAQENEEESLDIASSLLPPHYVKLKVNKPVGSLINKRVDIEESSLTQCDCDPSVPDPCGPYSQCLNRMLLTECGPICRAGDRCNNRAFEKRLYPKMVPYRTSHRGWGLKTLEDIKAGQFVIEYVGELIDEEEFKRRMARKHEIRDENFYFLTLDKERMIDAGPKGNLARFMNHCCEPNCETQKWTVLGDVRVGLFAIHDIPANSEVTFNYNLECAGIDKKRCMCGAKRCAGYIGAKPKQDESQSKKSKVAAKRTYKKRKNTEESPSTKSKLKRPVGRPAKPKELSEIEKDLLIIKNATNGLSSDSECSRLSSLEADRHSKALKRKRVSFSTEEVVCNGSPSVKKIKLDEDKVD